MTKIEYGGCYSCPHSDAKYRVYYVETKVTIYHCADCAKRYATAHKIMHAIGAVKMNFEMVAA